jgi:hypothetical protein
MRAWDLEASYGNRCLQSLLDCLVSVKADDVIVLRQVSR